MPYQQGDIAGVQFLTEEASTTIGRRTAIYQIPFSNKGVAGIDLGRAPRRYEIRALLLGRDYPDLESRRDALIEALESEGAKRLTHPYLGSVNVRIEPNITITEKTSAQLRVDVDFRAVEAREAIDETPSVSSLGSRASVSAASDALGSAISAAMDADVSVDGVADFVASANVDLLDDILDDLQSINGDIDALLAIPGNIASTIDRISQELSELLNTPTKLFDAIDAATDLVMQAINRVVPRGSRDSVGSIRRAVSRSALLGSNATPVPGTDTPARARQRQNHGQLALNMRVNAIRRAGDAAADLDYDSADKARATARAFTNAIDAQLEAEVEGQELNANVRRRLLKLRSVIRSHLEAKAGESPQLTTYTPPETLTASALAYFLYGDATRARREDIIARNESIKHPGFVRGGIAIEILTE